MTMPRYINKRNITIFIGIAVAILIVLSTTSFDTTALDTKDVPPIKLKSLITKNSIK